MKKFRIKRNFLAQYCKKTKRGHAKLKKELPRHHFLYATRLFPHKCFRAPLKKGWIKKVKTFLFDKIRDGTQKGWAFWIMVYFSAYTTPSQAQVKTLGEMAITITQSFYGLSKLITAGAYMAGMGFVMASMLKFKAHKDNPTQIPIGTPIALLFVGSALIFLPNIFSIAGQTIFGDTGGAAGIYGTTGLDVNSIGG